ncbi:photosystem II stability/assembly factor-like uncharacterized protein [Flavobacterium arsenatis]|uniref:Photosystem II stability/assembly factor-like uncharacterized protein n=1 Tax=Flavobacterium arsenatis TaxID=1484332 RepID=A0ABU1TSJ8_9FLAO|nr:T9SS type A sorting domain-containing protein [Flavobacterium arsenatis]MDR6968831.1 photosystem II stability/assembly factor-like uncharacterized protein [Flavobacterium arsenatis]
MQKIIYFIVILLVSQLSFAQRNPIIVAGKPVDSDNYFEITRQLDNYWASHPNRNKKGSGFKVYQRWKELWKSLHHEDGTLFTQKEVQNLYWEARNLTPSQSMGQNNNNNEINNEIGNWIPLGPFSHTNSGSWSSGQGRVNVTLVDPNNPNTIYIGTPNGGLWKSTDHGTTWANLTDFLPTIGVSGIAVDYANSNIVYISTGDEDASDSYSSGIFKSTDGGLTWSGTGFPIWDYSTTGEIYIHPTNSNILWVVSSQGFYKSTDAGQTWTLKNGGICKEMRLKPNDPNVIYLVENNYDSGQVYIKKSINGGETFTTQTTYNDAERTAIAVTPANENYLYVLVSNANSSFKGLYRSANSGLTFVPRNTTTDIYQADQAWFDLALTVSDVDPNKIFTGCLNIWSSNNGGLSFYQVNEWSAPETPSYSHADIHDLKFFNGKLYAGTDGGIYVSDDNGTSFSDKTKNGVAIGQIYRIDVKQATGTNIAGGLQDNGGYQLVNNQWYNYHGADGMDAVVHPTLNYSLGFIQFGSGLFATLNNQVPTQSDYVASSPNEVEGNWITPLEVGAGGKLYAGFDKLFSLNPNTFQWVGETASSFTNQNIDQIKVDPNNDQRVMFSSDNRLFISNGLNPMAFTELYLPGWGDITNFAFNHQNPQILYATKSDNVLRSLNGGATWENITYNLPNSRKVDIVHQSSSDNNTIYVALSRAVYYFDDSSTTWSLLSNGLPNTTITDLEVNAVENHVLVSTYGRGIWRTSVSPNSLSVDGFEKKEASLFFYPNPVQNGYVQFNSAINEAVTVNVFDMNGRKIFQKQLDKISLETKIDVSQISTGNYIIQLISEHHLVTKKLLVK